MYFKNSATPIPDLTHKSGRKNISKILNAFFIILQMFLSLDLGYVKNNIKSSKIQKFFRCFTVIQCLVTTGVIFYSFYVKTRSISVIKTTVVHSVPEYVALVILFAYLSKKTTFYDLQIFLHNFDRAINYPSQLHRIEVKLFISLFFILMSRLLIGVLFCTLYYPVYCFHTGLSAQLDHIPLYTFDTFLIIHFFLFYTVYCRLNRLKKFLKSTTDIVACQYLYKSIVDCTEDVKNNFNLPYLVTLIFTTPNVMAVIYMSFVNFRVITINPLLMVFSYFTSIRNLMLILAPAIVAGMLSTEADKMRIILHDRLSQERALPQSHIKDLKRFISYVEARPFKLRACRLIPLDSSLPVIVLNLFITYLIVIVQTTHLV